LISQKYFLSLFKRVFVLYTLKILISQQFLGNKIPFFMNNSG